METINRENTFGVRARIWLASLALLLCLSVRAAGAESDGMLRVKLARLGSPSAIQLKADCDYYLVSDLSTRIPAGTEMTVSASGGSLTLAFADRSVALGASARLARGESGNHGAQFLSPSLSNRFCGDLSFSASSGVITTVLHIYVEDYLYGVVGYEIGPSSGLEALKAQAIVARNYALRQKAARSGSAYDLSDSGDALSFRGLSTASEYADSLRAVDDTRGQVLYYGDSPATCYYCDSNGGQMESSANALGAPLPYSEVRDDPYDYDGAGAKKTATLRKDGEGLNESLAQALLAGLSGQLEEMGLSTDAADIRINAIEAVTPLNPRYDAPSRLYTALSFQLNVTGRTVLGEAQTGSLSVSVPTYGALEDWYELGINDAANETVWVTQTDRAFEITFRRSGSGVGMSQRGAQVMARKGLSCWDILDYYYPGTSLRQLTLSGGSEDGRAAQAGPAIAPIATARLSQKARLYEKADDSVGALTTLPAGAVVDVYAVQGDWAALGSGGIYGFAHTDALTSFALTGVTVAQVREETLAQVNAAVQVLQLPVEGAKSLAKLDSGDIVRLDAYSDEWALIATPAQVEGFIPRRVLTLRTNDAEGDAQPDSRPAAQSQITDGDGDAVTRVKGEVFRVVSADALPMYEINSTESAVLAILERGQRVQLGAYNAQWACVRADGLTGFVALSGLSEQNDSPSASGNEIDGGEIIRVEGELFARVKASGATLYATWNTSSEALATLKKGDRVQVGAYNSKWACVRADSVVGFVEIKNLQKTSK